MENKQTNKLHNVFKRKFDASLSARRLERFGNWDVSVGRLETGNYGVFINKE